MEKIGNKISEKYPCREDMVRTFYKYYAYGDNFPQAIYFYGHTSTGKSVILSSFLQLIEVKYVFINCIECYTVKILFESIINKFRDHVLSSENNYSSYKKIDCMMDFVSELLDLQGDNYVIVMENAEKLRDMDMNIFPTLLRLQEFTGLNISTIFVSSISFDKFYIKTGIQEVIKVLAPEYTKNEIVKILMADFPKMLKLMKDSVQNSPISDEDIKKRLQIIAGLNKDFYENYLGIFLNVFFKVCRDLKELQTVAQDCFKKYYEPVLDGTIAPNDVTKLWKHIAKTMKSALNTIYMRMGFENEIDENSEEVQTLKKMAQSLELPYYAKYLLVAAYLASHNAAKEDKRLFMKNHGKQKKRMQTVNAKAKVSEKMATQLGPKTFTIDRLLAIFYAIIDEKVGLTCNLLAQISTLIHLKFITFSAGESNVMDGSARLQCTVGMDFVMHIGKMLGFNVRQYLCDFF